MAFLQYKSRVPKGLLNSQYYIVDTTPTSPDYFNITQFPDTIGGGKSLIKLKGNGANLQVGDEIGIEVLDSQGNPVYYEVSKLIDRFNQYYITIHVYDNISPGAGTVTLTGRASRGIDGEPLPPQWQTRDSVVWSRQINIQPYERNNSDIVFYEPPQVTVAQVVLPERVIAAATSSFYLLTSSNNIFTITTPDFKGFDKTQATDNGITDIDVRNVSINLSRSPSTVNSVDTTTKTLLENGTGYQVNKVNRYNTVIKTSTPFFSSDYKGALFQITGSVGYDPILRPALPSNIVISGSLPQQVQNYKSTIIKVLNDTTAIVDQPVVVKVYEQAPPELVTTNKQILQDRSYDWTYRLVSGSFEGLVSYGAGGGAFITSSTVSQSYVEFTFTNIKPVAGQIYKIRPYYKLSGKTGDYKLLNDQIIVPAEYLTDARYPNQTSYGRYLSDYYLVGHFTETASLQRYWLSYAEQPSGFNSTNTTLDNTAQIASAKLQATTGSLVFTTNYYQNYVQNETYTLSTELTLAPNAKLEVYMNSETLGINTIPGVFNYPVAFVRSKNNEPTRYSDAVNRFGKLIGTITNNTNVTQSYGKVAFDFVADSNGLGRPLFRVRGTEYQYNTTAYLSEISITPIQYNGFTPSIVQFAVPLTTEFTQTLSQSVDFKLEYYDYTGNQSEYVTYLDGIKLNLKAQINTNGCQTEQLSWDFDYSTYHRTTTTEPTTDSIQAYPKPFETASFEQSFYFWPVVEYLQGTYVSGSTTYYTTDYASLFGLQNSITDVPMWNVRRPILISDTAEIGTVQGSVTHSNNYPPYASGQYSNLRGRITSSWNYVTRFTEQFGAYTGSTKSNLLEHVKNKGAYLPAGTVPLSVLDNRQFMYEGCVGITRASVSASYQSFNTASTDGGRTFALKQRRLMFPMNGSATASYFTQNGGIYSVKFKLKRSGSYSPDTGSYLDVYIFNANQSYTAATEGTPGWRPPTQNVVRIGHGYNYGTGVTPTLTNYDPITQEWFDEYDITLIQYGTNAQLVFEPGSGSSEAYFGTLIDDISFCKIGATTDPKYIQPTTPWDSWNDSSNQSWIDPTFDFSLE